MTQKILFFLNAISVLLNLVFYTISYIPPSKLSYFAWTTLLIPVFIGINILFLIYWSIKLDKKAFLPLFILIICIKDVKAFIGLNFMVRSHKNRTLKIQTYNTHYFKWNKKNFFNKYINQEFHQNSDVIAFQECYNWYKKNDSLYPEKSLSNLKKIKHHTIISSKNEVINWGYLYGFSLHNEKIPFAIYGDVKVNNRIIRFYSVYFHTYKLPKKEREIQKKGIKYFIKRFNTVFVAQEKQLEKLNAHIKESPYEVVIMGDFNNTAFSYLYKNLKREHNLKDTFVSKGNWLGSSHTFKYCPLRIDFILVPQTTKVYSHKVAKTKNMSDHYPITAEISFE